MKKHNDGYVLPFVLVVLVVVCLVAVSLMSNSLGNLQRQQASIERMQDKYVAMGEIERKKALEYSSVNNTYSENFPDSVTDAKKTKEYATWLTLSGIFDTEILLENVVFVNGEYRYSEVKLLSDRTEDPSITARVVVSAIIKADDITMDTEETSECDYSVKVTGSVTYTSYSHEGGDS